MIKIIKESMLKEKAWNEEIKQMLRDQVNYLKSEIIHKNTMIELLIVDINNRNHADNVTDESVKLNQSSSIVNTINTSNGNKNSSMLETSPRITENDDNMCSKRDGWEYVTREKKQKNRGSGLSGNIEFGNIESPNRYRHLVLDDHSNFDDEIEANVRCNSLPAVRNKSINCSEMRHLETSKKTIVNRHPENDTMKYKQQNLVPGNPTYSNKSSPRKKLLLLSDSICNRVRENEMNKFVKNGFVYKKSFSGASPKELAHYCTHTLMVGKPDTCVIHVGNEPAEKR